MTPHGALPRELILASAGSGKTFQISSRLIALLRHDAAAEQILASTFTRKAAAEILERVLDRLSAAALDPEAARELSAHTRIGPAGAAEAGPADWLGVLESLVRELHRASIGTLDSFFVRTARSFGNELGLPPAWGIADEATAARLRSDALQDVLAVGAGDELVELVRLLNRGDARRSVHDALEAKLESLLAIHHDPDAGASNPWDALARAVEAAPGPVADPAAACQALAETIAAVPVPINQNGLPNRSWAQAREACCDALRRQDWAALIRQGPAAKLLDGEDVYGGRPIPAPLCQALEEAFDHARAALGPRLAAQARALGDLAARFARVHARRQRERGAYRFDDVTRLIGGADPLGRRDDLWYRLDMQTRHVLLDEFQDTSLAQWSALEPLVDELLSGHASERAAVIVADPKQSIYGWRGAEPGIVDLLRERYPLDAGGLARSWRSSAVVLDLVNDVFSDTASNPVLLERDADGVCAGAAKKWAESFTRHEAARELPGYACVEVGPRDAGRSQERPLLAARAAQRVAAIRNELIRARGRVFSIGVLARTNAAVARLIYELRRLGVAASEEGGTPLTDSAAAASVLALLRMADHPGDRIARYHVARTPLGAVERFLDPRDGAAARELAHDVRDRLVEHGYGATLQRWAKALRPACTARERRRLDQLAELGFRYEGQATLRPMDFVRFIERTGVEDTTTADVRVMTLHKAKGLEFDIAVLPDLEGSILGRGGGGALPYRPVPGGRITAAYPDLDDRLRKLFRVLAPELHQAHLDRRGATVRDALSTIYVGLTRARFALHVLIAADGETGPGTARSAARLLRAALALDEEPAVDGQMLHERGDREWYRKVPASELRPPRGRGPMPDRDPTPVLLAPARRRRILPRRSPSELAGADRVDLRYLLRLDTARAMERGSIIHAWFQEIGWIEEGLPEEARLREIARRIGPQTVGDALDTLLVEFRRWLDAAAVTAALSRASYPAGARVERETPFVHREGDTLIEGVIDRLVLVPEPASARLSGPTSRGERIMAAEVLDYKTDDIAADAPDALAERAEHYSPQMAAYRRAVARRYGLPLEKVRAKLLFVRAGVSYG